MEMLQQVGLGAIPALLVYLALCGKIEDKFDKIYDRLNPLCEAMNKIQGYLEGKNDKS